MKMAIFGNSEAILGFKALGLIPFSAATHDEGVLMLQKIADSNEYGVLFITEDWADRLEEDLDKVFSDAPLPAIVPIPTPTGSTGAGLKRIKKFMEQAVGSDIFG